MENSADYRITDLTQLRAIIGEPGALVPKKLLGALDEAAIAFVRRAPFLVIATADTAGNQDAAAGRSVSRALFRFTERCRSRRPLRAVPVSALRA